MRQMTLNIEDTSIMPSLMRTLTAIKGVSIAPSIDTSLQRQVEEAREQYRNGEVVTCTTKEELHRHLESL